MCYKFAIMKAKKKPANKSWVVYLLRCKDNSLYTGLTNDIEKRLMAHNNGTGCQIHAGKTAGKVNNDEWVHE